MSVILQFHSKSKKSPSPFSPTALQDLSNFGLFDVVYGGTTFPTVEHAYQALKYSCTEKPELVNSVQIEFRDRDPADVKKAGSKATMKKLGVTLDVECWNDHKDGIMETLIKSKIDRHPEIKQILEIAAKNNIMLVHFSRSDMYWGAHVSENGKSIKRGENNLGKIYMSYYPDVLSSGSLNNASSNSSSGIALRRPPVRQTPPIQMTPPMMASPVKYTSPKTRKVPICPETKVLNPKTSRCVNRTSKLGKEILAATQTNKSPKQSPKMALQSPKMALKKIVLKKDPICPETKILNPRTRRCVNRTSKLGKEILALNV